jgi:hypothetical protein
VLVSIGWSVAFNEEEIENDPQLVPPLRGRAAALLGSDHVASGRPQAAS